MNEDEITVDPEVVLKVYRTILWRYSGREPLMVFAADIQWAIAQLRGKGEMPVAPEHDAAIIDAYFARF